MPQDQLRVWLEERIICSVTVWFPILVEIIEYFQLLSVSPLSPVHTSISLLPGYVSLHIPPRERKMIPWYCGKCVACSPLKCNPVAKIQRKLYPQLIKTFSLYLLFDNTQISNIFNLMKDEVKFEEVKRLS